MVNQFAKSLRSSMTDVEKRLWYLLRDRRLQGYKFRRQIPIGSYIVDFVCLSARLVVELDGGQHAEQQEKDAIRDEWLRSQAFTVLRFWNNEVLANTEGVLQAILEHCGKPTPHPRPSPARGEGSLESLAVKERWQGQAHESQLGRLRWRCRRGLLELDLWLGAFAESRLKLLNAEESRAFEALLGEADSDLLAWLEGRQPAPANHAAIIERIRTAG